MTLFLWPFATERWSESLGRRWKQSLGSPNPAVSGTCNRSCNFRLRLPADPKQPKVVSLAYSHYLLLQRTICMWILVSVSFLLPRYFVFASTLLAISSTDSFLLSRRPKLPLHNKSSKPHNSSTRAFTTFSQYDLHGHRLHKTQQKTSTAFWRGERKVGRVCWRDPLLRTVRCLQWS